MPGRFLRIARLLMMYKIHHSYALAREVKAVGKDGVEGRPPWLGWCARIGVCEAGGIISFSFTPLPRSAHPCSAGQLMAGPRHPTNYF